MAMNKKERDALARIGERDGAVYLCPKHHAERIERESRPFAPWWLWAILIAGVAVVWGAAAMEVL